MGFGGGGGRLSGMPSRRDWIDAEYGDGEAQWLLISSVAKGSAILH